MLTHSLPFHQPDRLPGPLPLLHLCSPKPLSLSESPSYASHMARVSCLSTLRGQSPPQGQSCTPQQAGSVRAIYSGLNGQMIQETQNFAPFKLCSKHSTAFLSWVQRKQIFF